jgi:hypothetical protein
LKGRVGVRKRRRQENREGERDEDRKGERKEERTPFSEA